MSVYLAAIKEFTPQLAALQQSAQANAVDSASLVALANFQSMTQNALSFAYVIVPLVLFVLWCVFQSVLWFRLKNDSWRFFGSFFRKFVVVSFILFLIVYLILRSLLQNVWDAGAFDTSFVQIVLLSFVIFYFSLIAFACLNKDPLKKFFKRR